MPQFAKDHFTVGMLIDALEKRDSEEHVIYDFCNFVPDDVRPYRGWNGDLALSWNNNTGDASVEFLLLILRDAIHLDKTHTAYKGGEFKATRETGLWVANWGNSTSTVICGVEDTDGLVVLKTRYLAH